jgi:S-adenosylmethionine:tRNA ribosyltransferase-isomerase
MNIQKNDPRFLRISDFSYNLPESKIAIFPLKKRSHSKLLVFKNKEISGHIFAELPKLLNQNHLLIFNTTKVIQARLLFERISGSNIEILCLEPIKPFNTFEQAFGVKNSCTWKCMVGNAKRWKEEWLTMKFIHKSRLESLKAKTVNRTNDVFEINFEWENNELTFGEVLYAAGNLPLPPYLNRSANLNDATSYQTVFANEHGSVAAPTAGLHFTHSLVHKLRSNGIQSCHITLHVGAGTFKPIKSPSMLNHDMHAECIYVNRQCITDLKAAVEAGKIITPVGTTSTRTIESLYWFGNNLLNKPATISKKFSVSQWQPYEQDLEHPVKDALEAVLNWMDKNEIDVLSGQTQILIAPGYLFKLTDALITNFHQPQSTLLLLIAAFTGESWRRIYDYALSNDYRFLSYGDSSLLYNNTI